MASTKKQLVQQLLAAAAAACEDKKAEDIRILALDPSESGLTDYFLICTGMSDRQNVAITDEIEIRLKRDFRTYPNSVEGRRQGEWVLMDYVDFIVHVFSAEKRAFYGLERLRKSATVLSIADLNSEIKAAIRSTRKRPVTKAAISEVEKKAVAQNEKKKNPKNALTPRKPPLKKTAGTKSATKSAPRKAIAAKPQSSETGRRAAKKSPGVRPGSKSTSLK
jgi:ribosome-associated protein